MAVNTYKKRPPPPTRVDLQPEEFDAILNDFGTVVNVTPSVLCPRRSGNDVEENDVNHDLNCPLCAGTLIVDLTELTKQTQAYIQGISLDKTYYPESRFDVKDCLISFPSVTRVSYWFKVEVVDFGSLFNQVIKRRPGNIDPLRYDAREADSGNFYALKDANGVFYNLGTDYTVSGSTLTWLTPHRPPTGKVYSIMYPIRPTFRVLEMLHENRYYYNGFRRPNKIPVQLPQQAHCRWDYLAKRGHDVPLER